MGAVQAIRPAPAPPVLDAIDLQIGLLVAMDLDQLQEVRRALHGMPLEELLAADPVWRADDQQGRPLMCSIIQPATDS